MVPKFFHNKPERVVASEDIAAYLEGQWIGPLYQLTFERTIQGMRGVILGPNQFREILELDSQFQTLKILKDHDTEQIFHFSSFLTFSDPTSKIWHQIRFITLETLSIIATDDKGQEVASLQFERAQ